jgi:hypothetical protein
LTNKAQLDVTQISAPQKAPVISLGIRIDALPPSVRNSRALTGNHLGQLGNVQQLPEIDPAYDDPHLRQIFQYNSLNHDDMEKKIHRHAASLLDQGQVQQAWQLLLMQV